MNPLKTFRLVKIKSLFLLLSFLPLSIIIKAQSAQVTEVITDFSGYWKSGAGAINPTVVNLSHNVLSFKYNTINFSTGVSDSTLNSQSITYTAGNFKALPISSIGGTVVSSNSTFILLPAFDDGVATGTTTPLPSVRIKDVITDGINGLNIGTGATNIPLNALLTFPISSIDVSSISDAKPDIICTQIAATGGLPDTLYFIDNLGARVGNTVSVAWASVSSVGNHSCDLYTLSQVSCDLAVINGVNTSASPKEIRLAAFKLSEFGITSGLAPTVVSLIVKPGGASDPAFVAYNADAFNIATPVITTQPLTQIICPGTSQNVTFSVIATGSGLSYQWRKDGAIIPGETSTSYTITNVTSADAGAYDVIVTNSSGSVYSSIAYLNTVIISQPSPVTQTIVTGNNVTISVSAGNATGFQWKRNGTDISGATASSYSMSPLTTSNGGVFTVSVINSSNSGCASVLSSSATVIPVTTVNSKSSGNLSVAATWGANADGTGSSPVNFTRAEHTFIVKNNANTGADLTIAGTLDVANATATITSATTLSAGRIIRSGTGALAGTSSSNLTVNGVSELYFKAGSQLLKNITVSANAAVTLQTVLNITGGTTPGTLIVNSGANFYTSDSLILKSDINGTARVGTSAGTITGKATIERYFPARRAWRLLGVPIAATGAATINTVWQEGAASSSANPNPGYGVHITGGNITDGFDQSPTNAPSIKAINSATTWLTIPNTNVIKITDYNAYMLFLRGNRSYDISTTTTVTTPTETILRVTGNLNQGTQTGATVNATGLTVLANPYASPVSFSAIIGSSSNVYNRLRVWDPNLAGAKGVGAFVTLDWDGSQYTAVPASGMTSILQAGQAFFVESANGITGGSLVVNEAHKNSTGSIVPFGNSPTAPATKLSINLKIFNADNSKSVTDGALARFDNNFSNDINADDAVKIFNLNDNLGIYKNNSTLTIERSMVPADNDTLHLKLTQSRNASYQLEIVPENFMGTNLSPVLYDKYLKTFVPVSPIDTTNYTFNINTAIDSSKDADRFSIVFRTNKVLSVKYTSVKAYVVNASAIAVEWKVENQQGNERYYVEKQNPANAFDVIGNALANRSTQIYKITDMQPVNGDNVYRIRSVSVDGHISYSNYVRVNLKNNNSFVSTFPNPVAGKTFTLLLQNTDKGLYSFNLVNTSGQVVHAGTINHPGNTSSETIQIPSKLSAGNYRLTLVKEGVTIYTTALIIK